VIATVGLLVYAVLLGVLGPRLLRRMAWSDRAPRLAIVTWQAACAAVLAAVVLAGLALVVPVVQASGGLAGLVDACQMMLRAHYGGAAQPVGAFVGFAGALGITVWTVVHTVAALFTSACQRRGHARVLSVVARRRPDLDAFVLDHDQPVAYCLPGRHRCVVLSTGTLNCLDEDQLRAVIAHERAHLRGRHDVVVNLATAIARAFPAVPLFRHARDEIVRLVEMLADDVAARKHDRVAVAAALITVAAGRTPAAALGAGGSTVTTRVRRLLAPHHPLPRAARAASVLGAVSLVTLPLALAANPAVMAVLEHHCHLPI
jgi:Zn-dependent protease with chaperone function